MDANLRGDAGELDKDKHGRLSPQEFSVEKEYGERLSEHGASAIRPGEHHASAVSADAKIFLADTDGKITVPKASASGRSWA